MDANTQSSIQKYFAPALSLDEKQRLYRMMEAIDQSATAPYFVYGGSLIGCLLYGELLPWDDDIDILCQRPEEVAVANYQTVPTWTPPPADHHVLIQKCFDPTLPLVHRKGYGSRSFPFIDMSVYYEEQGEVRHRSVYGGIDAFPRDLIFPLRRAKFGPIEVNIPNDARAVLALKFGGDWERTATPPTWDHRNERLTRFPTDRFLVSDVLELLVGDGRVK
jgi:hypothetical protein